MKSENDSGTCVMVLNRRKVKATLEDKGFRKREGDFGGEKLMHKYEMILYWSNVDGAFVAEVPELPGCIAHGDTQEAALKHVNQAIGLWIDTAREFGDPIPEPKGERLMPA